MANILLMDLDIETGKTRHTHPFPNLVLMKLSAYHKRRGDTVRLNFPLVAPDIVYASCVFTWHRQRLAELPPYAQVGGIGLASTSWLPREVEHIMPDYDLYAGTDFSMGFTSRGCIRRCPWCKVWLSEGGIKAWADFREFWDRRREYLKLLDNNLLAAPNWRDTLVGLSQVGVKVDFNQGLDIRLVNEENARLLRKVRLADKLRFAFDDIAYESTVREGISQLLKAGFKSRELSFYVLSGYGNERTELERMKLLASLNVEVYPMVYRDDEGKEHKLEVGAVPDIFWHGSRRNISRFLRVAGRLRW